MCMCKARTQDYAQGFAVDIQNPGRRMICAGMQSSGGSRNRCPRSLHTYRTEIPLALPVKSSRASDEGDCPNESLLTERATPLLTPQFTFHRTSSALSLYLKSTPTMKFSVVAIAATLAVASAANCDLTKVTPLLSDPNVATCTADSGFSFTSAATPTAEVAAKICASTACLNVLSAVKALGLGDCTLLGLQLETDLLTPIETACAGGAAATGSSAGSSTGSSAAASATVGSASADATVTEAPASSSSGSSASSTVATPAATTKAPTTGSAASSVAMASSAVVVAVAAAFF